jgi:nucleotide-binding universal stress UspA family protein
VLKNTRTPMLIIPEKARFVHPSKIAFAYNYESEISHKVLEELKAFIAPFESQLYIIDVEASEENVSVTKAVNGIKLEHALENISHTLHFPTGTDIIDGLIEFDETHQVDLLVMVPKRHSLFGRMFHPSNTRRMAFHTQTPILALHE